MLWRFSSLGCGLKYVRALFVRIIWMGLHFFFLYFNARNCFNFILYSNFHSHRDVNLLIFFLFLKFNVMLFMLTLPFFHFVKILIGYQKLRRIFSLVIFYPFRIYLRRIYNTRTHTLIRYTKWLFFEEFSYLF